MDRRRNPSHARMGDTMTDVALVWLALFGIWPIAHPEHDAATFASMADIVLHVAGAVGLVCRWKIVRRGQP